MSENIPRDIEVAVEIIRKGGYVPVEPLDVSHPPQGQPRPALQAPTQQARPDQSQRLAQQ